MDRCCRCKKQKESVDTVIDPYAKEINDIEVFVELCAECYEDSQQSI